MFYPLLAKKRNWEGKCPKECSRAARTFPRLFPLCLYILFLILDSNMTHVFQDTQSTSNLMILESQVYLYNLSSRNNDLSLRLTTSHKDVRN